MDAIALGEAPPEWNEVVRFIGAFVVRVAAGTRRWGRRGNGETQVQVDPAALELELVDLALAVIAYPLAIAHSTLNTCNPQPAEGVASMACSERFLCMSTRQSSPL